MNPLVLFDYIYYSIANFYSSVFDLDYQKRFAGMGLLSVFQLFNCMTLFKYLKLENYIGNDFVYIYVSVYILILIFNFIRYYKFIHFEMLEHKWRKDKKYIRLTKIAFTVCYIILSVALLG